MKFDPNIHHRQSIRLKGYDYAQNGAYFVTICTHDREQIFGKIIDEKMILNDAGKIAHCELAKTSEIRKNFRLDCLVVMPNHIHAIVIIDNPTVGAYCNTHNMSSRPIRAYCNTPLRTRKFQSPSNNLGSMVRGYKSIKYETHSVFRYGNEIITNILFAMTTRTIKYLIIL